jgi:RNA polymerase sigma factor (sigma-70 family)
MINNEKILKSLEDGDHDNVVALCEPIIYYYLHRTNFWNLFSAERDDLLQEGRIAVFRCAKTYDGRNKFSTYAHAAIRNAIYSYVKKMNLFNNMKFDELTDDINSGEEIVKPLTLMEELLEKFGKENHKEILQDYFINNKTQTEVAVKFGVSQQWVNTIINTFRKELKEVYGIE